MSTVLSADARKALVTGLMQNGMLHARACIAVDLAAQAADRAIEAFMKTLGLAPDIGIGTTATEIGSQVVSDRMVRLFEILHAEAQKAGIPSVAVNINTGASTNG
jgi:hypothetical protein